MAEAAVIGIPDDRMGEVGLAFVVVRGGMALDEAELATWARGAMANYKVPRRFAVVDAFPRNAGGKVLKTQLREQYRSG